jgi:hypothetical protein
MLTHRPHDGVENEAHGRMKWPGMRSSAGPTLCDSEDPGNRSVAASESLAVWHDPAGR